MPKRETVLKICPQCSEETAEQYMVSYEDKKKRKGGQTSEMCVVCYAIYAKEQSEVVVDRSQLRTGSLAEKNVRAGLIRLLVLGFILLVTLVYSVKSLVDRHKKDLETSAVPAGDLGTGSKKALRDPSKPEAAKATAANDKEGKRPDDKKPGPQKPGEANPGDIRSTVAKTSSPQDTLQEIQKLMPKAKKDNQAPKSDDASPEEVKAKEEAVAIRSGKGADKGADKKGPPSAAESSKKAADAFGQLSQVAGKMAPKATKMAAIAGRLSEVAARFAPKTDLAGPLQRVTPRKNATSSGGDLSLEGGKGQDLWDQLMQEAKDAGLVIKSERTASSTGATNSALPPRPKTPAEIEAEKDAKAVAEGLRLAEEKRRRKAAAAAAKAGVVLAGRPGVTLANQASVLNARGLLALEAPIEVSAATPGAKPVLAVPGAIVVNASASLPAAAPIAAKTTVAALSADQPIVVKANATAAPAAPSKQPGAAALHAEQPIVVKAPSPATPTTAQGGRVVAVGGERLIVANAAGAKTPTGSVSVSPAEEPALPVLAPTVTNRKPLPILGVGPLTQNSVTAQMSAVPVALASQAEIMSVPADALFNAGSVTLDQTAEIELKDLVAALKQQPAALVLVRGYTDSSGTEKGNLDLSKKRAEAVRAWLSQKTGVPVKSILAVGLGASEPIAANVYEDGSDRPEGRAVNRRITVAISPSGDGERVSAGSGNPTRGPANGGNSAQ